MSRSYSFIIAVFLFTVVSCIGGGRNRAGMIQENSSWRVTTDSYSDADKSFTFTSDTAMQDFPVLASEIPLLDKLYETGVNNFFNDPSTILFDRSTPGSIATLSLIDPELVAEAILVAARKNLDTRRDWPLEADNLAWIPATRDLYLATGNSEIVESVLPIARQVIDREIEVSFDSEINLFRGLLPGLPRYISRGDVMSIVSLSVNIRRAAALRSLAEMLGEEEGKRYAGLAQQITSAINDRFWIPEAGRYGCALWGQYYPVLITASDNLAQSLAILTKIATPEMAHSILNAMPLTDEGAPDVFPVAQSRRPTYQFLTQLSLFASASRMCNDRMTLLGLAASAASIFGGNDEFNSSGGAMAAAMLQSIAGISFRPDGLELTPFIPEKFKGDKKFTSLIYRADTLDINITGTGSKIARMEIDGIAVATHVIPDTLQGRHFVNVIMANNTVQQSKANMVDIEVLPPRPTVDSIAVNEFSIASPDKKYDYSIIVNGIACQMISDGSFNVGPSNHGTKFISAMAIDKEGYSSIPAIPRMVFNSTDTIIVDRSAIPHELRNAVLTRIARNKFRRHRNAVPTHLELTGSINSELEVTVDAPASGEYFVEIAYWRPSVNECFLTDLCVGDSTAGCFVMSAQRGFSNPLTLQLKKGTNRLKLLYHALPSGNLQTGACIEYLRFLPKTIQ